MEYQILNEKIKFNINKNVGKVLYIVEGKKRNKFVRNDIQKGIRI